ncbi:MAG TPA: single-stranded-DNA-specific exonuclease RecJ [Bacteroidia bacterium]|jgi:single-stranded-DNA-specific exonuclease|nr:single-stranded-DNA-specific exonuclease RecJ [Bacteroidia bacterium]
MEKRWNVMKQAPEEKVLKLSEAIRVSPVIANLLVQRGVETFDQAKDFFRPDLTLLHDPNLMADMDKAVKRITDAAMNKEKILVYGDYDVDGTSAVALVYTFLKWLGLNCDFYIPDRYGEGYGVSFKGVDYAKENGYTLIIALDCGIKAHDKVTYAKEKGIDFIICDHHKPDKTLPDAVAILNPKREDCKYPYKELPGCGIGFKLVQALAMNYDMPFETLEQYLDLVGLAIASDIVPINGENRILAFHGLRRINSAPRAGFQAIKEITQLKKTITVNDLVFVFGPRINSAGRLESGRNAVELLIADNPEKAMLSGNSINKTNFERRDVDTATTQEAIGMIQADTKLKKKRTTVLYNPEWHKGVIGIVASRLIEKYYYRPTIILTLSNGKITGSARSVKDFDLYEAIDSCSHLLEQFGGHKYAAGLTMKEENLAAFIELFEETVSKSMPKELMFPEIDIDSSLAFSDITPAFYNVLRQLAPFGPGNMTPVFISENVVSIREPMVVGSNHLRLSLVQANNPDVTFNAIGFDMGEFQKIAASDKPFKICYSLRENEWNGTKTIELNLKDLKA